MEPIPEASSPKVEITNLPVSTCKRPAAPGMTTQTQVLVGTKLASERPLFAAIKGLHVLKDEATVEAACMVDVENRR